MEVQAQLADSSRSFFRDKNQNRISMSRGVFIALLFTVVGILIASNFDLPSPTKAELSGSATRFSVYPVVERDGSYESPFVQVVEKMDRAVVNISARSRTSSGPWWMNRAHMQTSSGSGFFFRKDGYILTNNHVIAEAEALTVRTASGYEYEAEVIGADPQTDLAVIKVEPEEEITTIPFGDSEAIKVGDWAIAIGNPFPQQGLDRTVTVGVISAKGRSNLRFGHENTPQYQNYIQTDASINPGNSGGPLLNLAGQCVGVNAAISSPTGSSVGIGFAIPINLAKAIVPDLIEKGRAIRGWLGVYLSSVTEREAKKRGLDAVHGIIIDSVLNDSPAKRAGLQEDDIVLEFNGQDVKNSNQFMVLVSTLRAGMDVPVSVMRGTKNIELVATIGDRNDLRVANAPVQNSNDQARWLGMEMVTFTKELAKVIGAKFVEGVYVVKVYPKSSAYRASISEGTIIMEVNNQEITSVEDIQKVRSDFGRSKNWIPLIVQEPNGAIASKICRM